jgi:hypothetical protein
MALDVVYQRWLEFDPPAGVTQGAKPAVPHWVWPLPLSDGRAVVTMLYRPLGAGAGRTGPRTVILEVSATGDAQVWKPGVGYPAPVLFYVNACDDLVGMDLVKTGKVYACRPDGTHLWTLAARLKMGNLLAPRYFAQEGNRVTWEAECGSLMSGVIVDGGVEEVRPAEGAVVGPVDELRHPHTHLTRDGTLWVFDFDPLPRVTRVRVRTTGL